MLFPNKVAAATQAKAINATSKPYSTNAAPSSSRASELIKITRCFIFNFLEKNVDMVTRFMHARSTSRINTIKSVRSPLSSWEDSKLHPELNLKHFIPSRDYDLPCNLSENDFEKSFKFKVLIRVRRSSCGNLCCNIREHCLQVPAKKCQSRHTADGDERDE